jgi:hypothetical protein
MEIKKKKRADAENRKYEMEEEERGKAEFTEEEIQFISSARTIQQQENRRRMLEKKKSHKMDKQLTSPTRDCDSDVLLSPRKKEKTQKEYTFDSESEDENDTIELEGNRTLTQRMQSLLPSNPVSSIGFLDSKSEYNEIEAPPKEEDSGVANLMKGAFRPIATVFEREKKEKEQNVNIQEAEEGSGEGLGGKVRNIFGPLANPFRSKEKEETLPLFTPTEKKEDSTFFSSFPSILSSSTVTNPFSSSSDTEKKNYRFDDDDWV